MTSFTVVTVDDRPVLTEAVVLRRLIGPPDNIEAKVTAVGPDMIAVEFPDQMNGRPRIAVVHRRDDGTFQSLDRYTLGRAGPSQLDLVKAELAAVKQNYDDAMKSAAMYSAEVDELEARLENAEYNAGKLVEQLQILLGPTDLVPQDMLEKAAANGRTIIPALGKHNARTILNARAALAAVYKVVPT